MSIALIHKELHEGKGTDTLNFSAYLERLVENLFRTYRVGNINTSLNIELEENIFFDMDIAVPLGIIVNELVSNSLKYAFLGRDNGKI
jgi:two-component sensor histidine kinase